MKQLRAIDLFSGCGGLTVGLKQAGFRVIAAIERNPLAVETYKANHPEVKVLQGDIREISATAFMRDLRIKRGQLDVLAACPPCQGFSTLRTRNDSKRNRDQNNDLVSELLRFARTLRPRVVMMENVPRLEARAAFRELVSVLEELGYEANWDVRDAAHFGVPQRRKRLILLAGRGFRVPFPARARAVRTVRGAIGHLERTGKSRDELHNLPERRSKKIVCLIKAIPKDGGSRKALPRNRQLACHKRCNGFRDIYGRMAWDSVAPTITGGCHNPSKGRFLHPVENRAITIREAALLQSFPRGYRFPCAGGKEALALMIGNALPPEFIRRHALVIKKALQAK